MSQLIRGTKSELKGMKAKVPLSQTVNCVRPLLETSKSVILDTLHHRQIPYLVDKTNDSLQFTRNKIRHLVLPSIKRINPSYSSAITSFAKHYSEISGFLTECVRPAFEKIEQQTGSEIAFPIFEMREWHPVLQKHFLFLVLNRIYNISSAQTSDQPDAVSKQIETIIRCLTSSETKTIHLSRGWTCVIKGKILYFLPRIPYSSN